MAVTAAKIMEESNMLQQYSNKRFFRSDLVDIKNEIIPGGYSGKSTVSDKEDILSELAERLNVPQAEIDELTLEKEGVGGYTPGNTKFSGSVLKNAKYTHSSAGPVAGKYSQSEQTLGKEFDWVDTMNVNLTGTEDFSQHPANLIEPHWFSICYDEAKLNKYFI